MAALACQETRDASPNTYGSVNNPWEEEVASASLGAHISPVISRFHSSEDTSKVFEQNPVLDFDSIKDITTSPSQKAYSSNESSATIHRSVTDLPAALVSEILHRLNPKELGIVSCVSTALNRIASDHHGWKEFYCERWGLPLGPIFPCEKSWKVLFVEREFRSKTFMGRYSVDALNGHTEAVRSVFLLPSAKLIFTGGYDSVVRMWDMEEGLSIMSSRPLGCTIRAVVADMELLVAGGTDGFLQCWRASEGFLHLFEISGSLNQNSEFRLWEHEGPVTCLALDSLKIYSGSWDMSVRVWDRIRLKCVKILRHGDWVWSLVPRGSTIATSAGRDAYIWDIESGHQVSVIQNVHVGNAYCLARSHSGDLLFTGGEDGAIRMYKVPKDHIDENITTIATCVPHTGPVLSLAFEFPWLVSSSSDGKLALIDVRKLLQSRYRSSVRGHDRIMNKLPPTMEPPQRMLHGFGPNLFSVDIGADRIVCGGEEGVVRIWNFSQALQIEKGVQALRCIRLENRMRRRRIQAEKGSNGRVDQCSVTAKRNQANGVRSGIWLCKRGATGKLKV
ncbi:F-box/WD-40 repeat-containing protein At5g21040-like [Aristolochia californica]|uniref:F-box/WD-40 repeat-containing protein At5g21040-like n=1 Tax=Aristolochia californica TaxID=171875 RepID=UPI0035DDFAE7